MNWQYSVKRSNVPKNKHMNILLNRKVLENLAVTENVCYFAAENIIQSQFF